MLPADTRRRPARPQVGQPLASVAVGGVHSLACAFWTLKSARAESLDPLRPAALVLGLPSCALLFLAGP
jgi:hypothetical protein